MSGSVALEELRALFTGVPSEDGEWSTSPFYTVQLALEIARRCDAQNESSLRTLLYDTTPCEDIPEAARTAIKIAAERYLTHRELQKKQKKRSSL